MVSDYFETTFGGETTSYEMDTVTMSVTTEATTNGTGTLHTNLKPVDCNLPSAPVPIRRVKFFFMWNYDNFFQSARALPTET